MCHAVHEVNAAQLDVNQLPVLGQSLYLRCRALLFHVAQLEGEIWAGDPRLNKYIPETRNPSTVD